MGGKALKIAKTRRYEKDEFDQLASNLIPKVKEVFNTSVEIIKSYHEKDTFGDMDLLVLVDNNFNEKIKNTTVKQVILDNFDATEVFCNGGVYSFDYQELQVDLILTPVSNWNSSQVFFAYNDLGNLMGKIYYRFNLKYGFDGVKYVYRENNENVLGTITITKDMRKAFEFIGLSYDKFLQGFSNLEEIFNYVISSPYFDRESFRLENLNSINKKRNNKRKVYQQFLEWLTENNITKSFPKQEDKNFYFNLIEKHFPESNFKQEREKLIEKNTLRKELTLKFNGDMVMEKFPHLKGAELGKAINNFKKSKEDFSKFLQENSAEEIMKLFTLSLG